MYDYWDLIKKYKDLQQENKQLKEKIDILLEDNNQLEEIRIKVTEYLKAMQNSDLIFTAICEKELLQILEGNENE